MANQTEVKAPGSDASRDNQSPLDGCLRVLHNRIRNLRKQVDKATGYEEAEQRGDPIDELQKEVIKNKPMKVGILKELEELKRRQGLIVEKAKADGFGSVAGSIGDGGSDAERNAPNGEAPAKKKKSKKKKKRKALAATTIAIPGLEQEAQDNIEPDTKDEIKKSAQTDAQGDTQDKKDVAVDDTHDTVEGGAEKSTPNGTREDIQDEVQNSAPDAGQNGTKNAAQNAAQESEQIQAKDVLQDSPQIHWNDTMPNGKLEREQGVQSDAQGDALGNVDDIVQENEMEIEVKNEIREEDESSMTSLELAPAAVAGDLQLPEVNSLDSYRSDGFTATKAEDSGSVTHSDQARGIDVAKPEGFWNLSKLEEEVENRSEVTAKILELMHVVEFLRQEPNGTQALLEYFSETEDNISAQELEYVMYFGVMLTTPNGDVPHQEAVEVSATHCEGYLDESEEEAFTKVTYRQLAQIIRSVANCPLLKERGVQTTPVDDENAEVPT
eukprot:Plantae.Rhodophyta-Hildenbrandia_rubra.ctg4176.p2 GENE.Plantae.Rhodophyta-Hildenbrandia_rubra.ctg4176~~Plantae.Rhodophyta-Hildenbrandia_rubra.ctg4176.p2  ORF type:complete len:497 (-),score=130.94 Plantae.Rhodophyta-Hildenbrandia_rubra.ctg4176:602-2092(-)